MDQFLLHAVASEAAGRLVEQELLRVSHLGRHRYLLRFSTPRHDGLLISVRPDLPRFHLMLPPGRVREEPPDRFAAFLDQEIGGAVLIGLEKRPWDRVIEMRFRLPRRDDGGPGERPRGEGGPLERRLVVEILGRSSNILLLDPDGIILGYGRDLGSDFRSPRAGAPYQPPPGREAYHDIPPGPEALPLVRQRFADPGVFLAPLSPLLARDLRAIAAEGPEAAHDRLAAILAAAATGRWSPVVYSARPIGEFAEGDVPGRDDLVVAPLPLAAPPGGDAGGSGPIATPFKSPSEAAGTALGLLERLRDFQDLKTHHQALARREADRLAVLVGKLEGELERARDSERFRRLGEALLAGMTAARIEGSAALVPDPYDAAAPPLSVPINPALPLQETAQALFARYKKGKRGLAAIGTRLQAVRRRLDDWRELEAQAARARLPADLEALRESMARLGLVHARPPSRSAAAQRTPEPPARVRRVTSRDGFVILVGKSGAENDALTFKIAGPDDFWLHAADRPGAHVVVRNPQRIKTLPDSTLRLAAEIAAYYSGARDEGKVEVHYTQRKHVRKRKGMPAGQVLVRKFRAVQVAPRLPAPTLEEA
jgi:predicted ribosome quality control (RQC) complex YloA/Tae2 family protein